LLDDLLAQWAKGSDFWQSLETSLDGNVKISGLPAGMTEAQYRNLVGVLEILQWRALLQHRRQRHHPDGGHHQHRRSHPCDAGQLWHCLAGGAAGSFEFFLSSGAAISFEGCEGKMT
jgi:hypothetical protein